MIHLKKGQPLYENPGMVVADQTGYYDDGASILCAPVYAPDEPTSRFEAKYIAFGPVVYNITDPNQLLEEIKKMDPESLFGKTSDQIAQDKKVQDIEMVEPAQDPSEIAAQEPEVQEDNNENAQVEVPVEEATTATTTVNTSTTTPAVSDDLPKVVEPETPPVVEATSTPVVEEVVPVLENVIDELGNVSEVLQNATSTEIQN